MARTNQIRPWVRANCYVPNEQTRELVSPVSREHYDLVLSDVGRTSLALALAQEAAYLARLEYEAAHIALAAFFNEQVVADSPIAS